MNMNGAVNMNMQMRRADSLPAVFFLRWICQKMTAVILHPSQLYDKTGLLTDLTGEERYGIVSDEAKSKKHCSMRIKTRSNTGRFLYKFYLSAVNIS